MRLGIVPGTGTPPITTSKATGINGLAYYRKLVITVLVMYFQDSDLFEFAGPGTPYSDLTGLQTIKKDGKVMRPMNAFMLWAKAYRSELIAKG